MGQVRWVAAFAGAVVLIAGCGGDGDGDAAPTAAPPETTASVATAPVTTTETTPTTETETTPDPAEVSPDSLERPDTDGDGIAEVQTFRGELGDTFTLVGMPRYKKASEEAAEVTVLETVGPFSGFDVPRGSQLVGVTVRIKSVGEKPYKDPQPGGDLIVTGSESGRQTSLITGTGENPCDNPRLNLSKGESATVCIAYQIPKSAKPKTFEFAMSSGYGDVGIWKLR